MANGDNNGNGNGNGGSDRTAGLRIPLLIDSGLLVMGIIGIGWIGARQQNVEAVVNRVEQRMENRESGQQDILNRLARIESSNSYILQTVGDMRSDLKDKDRNQRNGG